MNPPANMGGSETAPESQSLAAPVIECAPLPMVEVEGKLHLVCFVNPAFCRLLNKTREELIGQPFERLVRNGEKCAALLDRVYETGEFETHVDADHSEPEPTYWLYAMWPALGPDDTPHRVVIQLSRSDHHHLDVVAMNEALLISGLREHELREDAEKSNSRSQLEIAERILAEQALRESEQRYRTLFNSIDQGFCIIELIFVEHEKAVDWLYVEVNPSFEQQTGLHDAAGKRVRELAPELEEHWFEVFGEVVLTGEPVRFTDQARTLEGRWFDVYAFRIGGMGDPKVAVLFTDITERERNQEKLAEKARLLDLSNDAIIVRDLDDKITSWNKGAEKLFGWSSDEIIGKDLHGLLHTEFPKPRHEIVAQLYRERDFTGEVVQLTRTGQRIPLLCRWVLDLETKSILTSYTDISARKAAELKMEAMKDSAVAASRAKDDFIATLSHELRTPLTPVMIAAAALREDRRLPRDVREQLGMIERNVALEARLIDDLLDLTKISHGKLTLRSESCDAHSLIGLAIEIVRDDAREKGIMIERNFTAEHYGLIAADPARFQQVVWNLLRNAVKFTPRGGKISIRTTDENVSDATQWLRIEVTDTGIGIDPAGLDRIFLPFDQGTLTGDHRFGGVGLGLAIARAVVVMHGGRIAAQSPGPNLGATFVVELPGAMLPKPGVTESTAPFLVTAAPERQNGAPLRLLLVEDHVTTLRVLLQLLLRDGHRVVAAASVADALAAAAANTFDLVVSDLGLPDGSGIELMEKLRAMYGLRGIALSGYGMEEDLARSSAAGFVTHLIKPVSIADLRRVLASLMPPQN